jgi:hypothetical protein
MSRATYNLVPRACDPWEGNEGSGIIRCRKPGILAKIELRIHFNGQSDSSLKRIIPEPSFPSQGSQARGTRLGHLGERKVAIIQARSQVSYAAKIITLQYNFIVNCCRLLDANM